MKYIYFLFLLFCAIPVHTNCSIFNPKTNFDKLIISGLCVVSLHDNCNIKHEDSKQVRWVKTKIKSYLGFLMKVVLATELLVVGVFFADKLANYIEGFKSYEQLIKKYGRVDNKKLVASVGT